MTVRTHWLLALLIAALPLGSSLASPTIYSVYGSLNITSQYLDNPHAPIYGEATGTGAAWLQSNGLLHTYMEYNLLLHCQNLDLDLCDSNTPLGHYRLHTQAIIHTTSDDYPDRATIIDCVPDGMVDAVHTEGFCEQLMDTSWVVIDAHTHHNQWRITLPIDPFSLTLTMEYINPNGSSMTHFP